VTDLEDSMNGTDQDVRSMLYAGTGDMPAGIDLLRGVRERQSARQQVITPRWSRPRTRVAVAASVATVIAAGAVTAVTTRSETLATGTENSASARAQLLAAVERTGALSYSFSMMTDQATKSGVHPAISFTTRGGGEMAPSVRKGLETLTSRDGSTSLGSLSIRWLGPYEYVRLPGSSTKKPWTQVPLSEVAFLGGVNAISTGTPEPGGVNPQDLLRAVASRYDVRAQGRASGDGWTGTRYAFAGKSSLAGGIPGLGTTRSTPLSVTGTVDVDSHGTVRQFTEVASPLSGQKAFYRMEITFGDFGVHVSVSAPPTSQTRIVIPPSAQSPKG
jgi:hypothetical protein